MMLNRLRRSNPRPPFSIGALCALMMLPLAAIAPAENTDVKIGAYGFETFPVGPPQHLPDPIPDLVAMIWAERPVQLDTQGPDPHVDVNRQGSQGLGAIRYRARHGDVKEAARLYRIFAHEHPGTWAGAEALYRIAPSSRGDASNDRLNHWGGIALELAEQYPTTPLTPRALFRFLDNFAGAFGMRPHERCRDSRTRVPPSKRFDPSGETWQMAFRAAAVLAGRYPADIRGPGQLLDIADILALSPHGKPRAVEIYQLVSRWPDAWDARFRAFHALHNEAMSRNAPDEARAIAEKAVLACAGHVSRRTTGISFFDTPLDEEPDTPWNAALNAGLSPDGPVLLDAPDWHEDDQFAFESQESLWRRSERTWQPTVNDENEDAKSFMLYARIWGDVGNGKFAALASHELDERLYHSRVGEQHQPEFTLLDLRNGGSTPAASLLLLPKFPVHSGVEIYVDGRGRLIRQEAHAAGEDVIVTLSAPPEATAAQTWRAGEPWWREATIEYVGISSFGATNPPRYEQDPGWNTSPFRRHATRTNAGPPPFLWASLEMQALANSHVGLMDKASRTALAAWLPQHFSGDELTSLQDKYTKDHAWSPESAPSDKEQAALATARRQLADGAPDAALATLNEIYAWRAAYDESLVLRATALKALDRAEEANAIVRWLPQNGPFATSGSQALLSELKRSQAQERPESNKTPLARMALRMLWSPPEAPRSTPAAIRVERTDDNTTFLVADYARWRWRITPDGDILSAPDALTLPLPDRYSDGLGMGRVEFGRRGGTVFVKEADRILAEGPDGKEIWRYTVEAQHPDEGMTQRHGLPRLADPCLVSCPGGERIICGVGQRTVYFGMNVGTSPVAGGLLALDVDGQLLYEREVGYCEALSVLLRNDETSELIALLWEPLTQKGGPYRVEGIATLAALESATGDILWSRSLGEASRTRKPYDSKSPLYIASSGDKRSIVVSLPHSGRAFSGSPQEDRVLIFDLEGRQFAAIDNARVHAVVDMDSDGADELVVIRAADPKAHWLVTIAVADLAGHILCEGPPGNWELQAIDDFDADGIQELLALRRAPCPAVALFGVVP